MKRTVTIGLLGAILAITVGFVSTNAISATPFLMAASDLSTDEAFDMIGHVEYTVLDSNGQIKQYIQGDNIIVDQGRNCAALMIFDNSLVTPLCTSSAGTTGFNVIAIGNGTFVGTDLTTQLNDSDGLPGCLGTGDFCEMQRTTGTVSITNENEGTTIASVTTDPVFTFNHAGDINIMESGLFDGGIVGEGNMFSNRAVSPTGITVSSADTLQVTWTITVTATPP